MNDSCSAATQRLSFNVLRRVNVQNLHIIPLPTAGFFRDIFGARETGLKDGREDFVVHAFMLDHPVPCVGYLLLEPAPLPRLRADKAVALGVKPGPLMGRLKRVS